MMCVSVVLATLSRHSARGEAQVSLKTGTESVVSVLGFLPGLMGPLIEAGLQGSSWKVSVSFLASESICLWCENCDLGPCINALLAHFPACTPAQTYQSSLSLRMFQW